MSCNKPMKSAAFGNFACGDEIQGGVRFCEDCLRKHRANAEFLGQKKPELNKMLQAVVSEQLDTGKRDFDNLDTRLYLALAALRKAVDEEHPEWVSHSAIQPAWAAAGMVMLDFEDSHGPLPEWAIARNFGLELTPGAQLFTKNGRRSGNGWLIKVGQRDTGREIFTVYTVLTDAGSSMDMTEQELETQFEVGDWICTLDRIASDFDRHGVMKEFLRG